MRRTAIPSAILLAALGVVIAATARASFTPPPPSPEAVPPAPATPAPPPATSHAAASGGGEVALRLPPHPAIITLTSPLRGTPRTPSRRPTKKEWAGGAALDGIPAGCVAQVVREWLRIECKDRPFGAATLLSGSLERMGADVQDGDEHALVVIQMRPGDRRLIQLTTMEIQDAYAGTAAQDPGFTLSEVWLGESPEVVMN